MDATAQTLPQYFLHQAQTQPAGKVAMRQKEFGIWREFTWNDSYELSATSSSPSAPTVALVSCSDSDRARTAP